MDSLTNPKRRRKDEKLCRWLRPILTLSVLALIQGQLFIEYRLVAAGATVTALPLLLVFFVFQRRIITAVTLTGLKGT